MTCPGTAKQRAHIVLMSQRQFPQMICHQPKRKAEMKFQASISAHKLAMRERATATATAANHEKLKFVLDENCPDNSRSLSDDFLTVLN